MRIRYAVVVLLIAVVALTASVTGQEEPLPAVTPRTPIPAELLQAATTPSVYLVVEPLREPASPDLATAARSNDYVTFNALYLARKTRGESVAEYATLHELWTWAMSDPVGAFYGRDMHDRLARAYPGFAAWIDDYRIVDDHGSVFYPTSETRAFLLDRALERRAPRVLLASESSAPATRSEQAAAPAATTAPARRTAARPSTTVARRAVTTRVETPAVASPASAPAPAVAPPVTVAETAVPVAPNVTTPETTVQPTSAATAAAQSAAVEPAEARSAEPVAQAPVARDAFQTRGILLLVIGLVGIGLLAVMLRTPKETAPMTIIQPGLASPAAGDLKPEGTVEPLRRPAAKAAETPRASGSRG